MYVSSHTSAIGNGSHSLWLKTQTQPTTAPASHTPRNHTSRTHTYTNNHRESPLLLRMPRMPLQSYSSVSVPPKHTTLNVDISSHLPSSSSSPSLSDTYQTPSHTHTHTHPYTNSVLVTNTNQTFSVPSSSYRGASNRSNTITQQPLMERVCLFVVYV